MESIMNITVLCSDEKHPVNEYLYKWREENKNSHQINIVRTKSELQGGNILFLISCSEIITHHDRGFFHHVLVIHASDLPLGRGWSPHIWQILEGKEEITLSLLEAEDKVDSGRIWAKKVIRIPAHALWKEINEQLFSAELALMDIAVQDYQVIIPTEQDSSIEPTYYARRAPSDSQLNPDLSLAELFNQIRVCDSERFPAFFELHGKKYKLILEKYDD